LFEVRGPQSEDGQSNPAVLSSLSAVLGELSAVVRESSGVVGALSAVRRRHREGRRAVAGDRERLGEVRAARERGGGRRAGNTITQRALRRTFNPMPARAGEWFCRRGSLLASRFVAPVVREIMGRRAAVVLYVLALVAVVVGADVLFFRSRFWERLMVNVGIVLVFAAFGLRFLERP
jgi:hypothetical protein